MESVGQQEAETVLDEFKDVEAIAKFFKYKHLPERLGAISSKFAWLACFILRELPRNAERTVALRKILEGKDAAVRAAL